MKVALLLATLVLSVGFMGSQGHDHHYKTTTTTTRAPATIDPQKGYALQKLGDGLYYVTEGVYMAMFLTTGKGVIVVDAPPTLVDKLLLAIKEVTDEPITHVIYSHTHADHIAGAYKFPAKARYIAHEATLRHLKQRPAFYPPFGAIAGGQPIPLPTNTFSKSFTLVVGSQKLILESHDDEFVSHQEGNLYIYAPKQKVLYLVDIVFPGGSTFYSNALAETTLGFVLAHDKILTYKFDYYIGGHWARSGTRKDVEVQREYFHDISGNVLQALGQLDIYAIITKASANPTSPVPYYIALTEAVSQKCAELTLAKWKGRLLYVKDYTKSHCYQFFNSVRLD